MINRNDDSEIIDAAQSRRDFMIKAAMATGLTLSYGLLGVQSALFILPQQTDPERIRVFAGNINQFKVGEVQTYLDLEGAPILLRRTESGIQAFGTTCPHLGCKVHWEEENHRFFCPCHSGVFDENGVATAGPPYDAGQSLSMVPVSIDETSGVIYLELKAPTRRS